MRADDVAQALVDQLSGYERIPYNQAAEVAVEQAVSLALRTSSLLAKPYPPPASWDATRRINLLLANVRAADLLARGYDRVALEVVEADGSILAHAAAPVRMVSITVSLATPDEATS